MSKAQRALDRRNPALGTGAYGRLWGMVDGSVKDAFKKHPDYLTPKGLRSARTSIVKRVTGTVIGFAEQSAKSRVAAEMEARAHIPEPQADGDASAPEAGGGASPVAPTFRVRIGKVTPKARQPVPLRHVVATRQESRAQQRKYRETHEQLRREVTEAKLRRAVDEIAYRAVEEAICEGGK